MDAPMIAISDLSKVYGATHALRGITFEVPRGQVVGFLGPNGAGKSTTMKILTGFVRPTEGGVKVAGIDVTQTPVEAQKRIGYLPESNPLYDEMMVQEYLEYLAEVRHIPVSERDSRIEGVIARCGIAPVRGKNISQLSKGYRQRVGLAAAILHDPDLLILDEPTTGLDPNQVLEIRDLIKELGQEKTVLMSTHILPEVEATCSRVLVIADGEIVTDSPTESLTTEMSSIEVLLAPREGKDASLDAMLTMLRGVPGVEDVDTRSSSEDGAFAFSLHSLHAADEDPRRALFDACVKNDLVLLGLERKQVSLEETFRRLTT
jgi:ABC-2 type transport system ATP-binding protein